jgi:hypothetical protein
VNERPSAQGGVSPLTIALVAGVLATFVLLALRFQEPRPTREGAALVAPIEQELPDAGESFVPILPAVPDLAADRAARTGRDEPRSDERNDALAQEMRLVHEARLKLDEDPHESLALLEQHRLRFPEGALREEREAYTILAMVLSEAPDGEVERRFADLVADHPRSSFAPAIREAITARAERRERER